MTKFGKLKQNHMRRAKHRSRSKSEVKLLYGGSPFTETGSSYISAVDGGTSSKFGSLTDFHLLKRMKSLALNTEVAFGFYGRHLEKSILCLNFAGDRLIETKFCILMQNHMPMTTHGSKLKQEIEFQYGDRPFFHTVSSFISTVDWDISSKFCMHIDFHHFERMQSLKLNWEVHFRLYDRHLEKSIWRQKYADICQITTKFRRRMQQDMRIITVCTVVQNHSLHGSADCCKGRSKSIGNGTFLGNAAEKPLNRLTQNLAWVITSGTRHSTPNGMSIGSGAWPPRRGEMLMVCAFFCLCISAAGGQTAGPILTLNVS